MSDLLNDSPTAMKMRDRILAEIGDEQVLYVTDGQVYEPLGGNNFVLYIGAVIVTDKRLLVVESKALGRMSIQHVAWRDIRKSGRYPDGEVGIEKSGSRPVWKISIWEGKSFKTPLDKTRLQMLSLAIQEARAAVQAGESAQAEDAYEELKRRRGF